MYVLYKCVHVNMPLYVCTLSMCTLVAMEDREGNLVASITLCFMPLSRGLPEPGIPARLEVRKLR